MFLAALLGLGLRTEEMFLCCWHEQNNVNRSHVIHDRSTQAVRGDGCPSLSVTVWTGRFSVKLLQQNKLCLRDDFCRTVQMVVVFQGAWRQRNTHLQVESEVCGVFVGTCDWREIWGMRCEEELHSELPTWYTNLRPLHNAADTVYFTSDNQMFQMIFLVFLWCWKKTQHKAVSFVC